MTDGVSGVDAIAQSEDIGASGNETTDSLLTGVRWRSDTGSDTTTISFSFANANSQYSTDPVGGYDTEGQEPHTGLASISSNAQGFFLSMLANLESFSNLEFTQVADSGDSAGTIRTAFTGLQDEDAVAWAYLPGNYQAAGDIWILSANHSEDDVDFGHTLLHELGHALGLKHSFETEGGFPAIASSLEGVDFTVMSYSVSGRFPNAQWADLWPQTYMYADILAIQYLYGVDTETTAGTDTYVYDQSERHYVTVWDYGGTDTLGVSGSSDVKLDLRPGSWSNVGTTIRYQDTNGVFFEDKDTVYITPDTVIEHAYGAEGDDTVTGNAASNELRGNGGDDVLSGGEGADLVVGGAGDDVAVGGDGNDTLWAGAGDAGDDVSAGGAGDDVMGGSAGDDLLIGGGLDDGATRQLVSENGSASDDGNDTLFGGAGDDTLLGGGWDDNVSDNGRYDEGEAVTSGTGEDRIWSGSGDDLVVAAAGDDVLGGGIGDDTIEAGGGDDIIYGGRDAGDTGLNDVLHGGAGGDTVFGGAGNDMVTGGAGNDNLFSGAGTDTVDGGAGNDTLWGGAGDDRFTGGSGDDLFVFSAGHGDDTVTDFSLADDTLQLDETTTDFTSAADVTAAASISGGNLVIDLGGGDSLTLEGLSIADINLMTLVL